jgi:hypothetical protein
MTSEFDVVLKVKADGGYFTSRAMLHERGSSESSPIGSTGECTSRERSTAVSYALTELATLLDRGAIKLP